MSTSSHNPAGSRLFDKQSRNTLDPDIPIEEETLKNSKAEAYYPVRLCQVMHDRYLIIGKLVNSTVWLGRDQKLGSPEIN